MLTFKRHNNGYYIEYRAKSESGNEYRIVRDDETRLWNVQRLDGLRWNDYRRFTEYDTLKEAKGAVARSFSDTVDRKLGYFN